MQTITFVFKCSNSNILEGAVGSKALCARRSWVIVMCSVGETFYSSGISPRLWNNWLFILEYSLVLAAIYLVNRSLKRFDLSDLSGVGRNILVYSRIILFFYYFFRLNRTLRHLRLFINGCEQNTTGIPARVKIDKQNWMKSGFAGSPTNPIFHFHLTFHFR